jgi:hypothetical protein
MAKGNNRYTQIIEHIFLKYYTDGADEVAFERRDIIETAERLGIALPKNLGDVLYSFRYRARLPESITSKVSVGKEGYQWIIRPAGRAMYKFVLAREATFIPNLNYAKIKIPDSTPGIVSRYSFDDEQALLAKIRYNRLIDIFTGITCYSLQNHLRTTVVDMGQVETDEVYVGIDKQGIHYVFPVQAKGGTDKLGAVQIEQDFAVCAQKYPKAVGRPIAAQFMDDQTIVLFEFILAEDGVKVVTEKHYLLVPTDELSDDELVNYRNHTTPASL